MLVTVGLALACKVLDLAQHMRQRECYERGRAIKWAT
jgi:hypothetical protein